MEVVGEKVVVEVEMVGRRGGCANSWIWDVVGFRLGLNGGGLDNVGDS